MTTHLKQGWLRRNGVPESDQTTLIEQFTRHGRNVTHTVVITDPVYLSEPLIRTSDFVLNEQDGGNWLWPCEYVEEISGRAKGEVPHHLPGANPFLKEFADRTKAPMGGVRGGPATTYPEYEARLKSRARGRDDGRGAARQPGEEPGHGRGAAAAGAGQRLHAGRRRRQRRRAGGAVGCPARGLEVRASRSRGSWPR